MVGPVDNQETQVLDTDSPPLEDTGTQCDGSETENADDRELVKKVSVLYGETEALEDPESPTILSHGGTGDWGKTQLIDDCEEMVDDDGADEGTERTEVLSGDEDLSDDGTTPCEDKKDAEVVVLEGRGGEENINTREHEENETLVDSDATTDEESDGGSVPRKFTSVRVASIRSSALAAARNYTSKTTSSISKFTLGDDQYSKIDCVVADRGTSTLAIGMHTLPSSRKDITSCRTLVDKFIGHENENSHGCTQNFHKDGTKNRSNNRRVKKLFNDVTPEKDGNRGVIDSGHLLASDYGVPGLSYIESHEPGELSQATALEVVDKLILVNDVGSSQEENVGNIEKVKSPPISGKRGAQRLASKADHRSPFGKAGIFEWVDSLEDDRGGEFFSKRKDSFFQDTISKGKSQSYPPKTKLVISGTIKKAHDRSGEKEKANLRIRGKMTGLAYSDSRIMMQASARRDAIQETKTKRNIFKELDEKSNSKCIEQQNEDINTGECVEGMYTIGPDTQMAVEAIEALGCGSPARPVMERDGCALNGNMGRDGKVGRMRTFSKSGSNRKRISTSSEGVITRSRKKKMLCSASGKTSAIFSNEYSGVSGSKKSLQKRLKTKTSRKKWISEVNISSKSLVNGNVSSHLDKREQAQVLLDGNLSKGVLTTNEHPSSQKRDGSLEYHIDITPVAHRTRHSKGGNLSKHFEISAMKKRKLLMDASVFDPTVRDKLGKAQQHSIDKEIVRETIPVNIIPVAHRTRHSERVNLLEQTELSSNNHVKGKNKLMDETCKALEREDKLVTDESGLAKDNPECPNLSYNQVKKDEVIHKVRTPSCEGSHRDELRTDSLIKDALCHPRQRRTSKVTLEKTCMRDNTTSLSTSVYVMPVTVMPSSKKRRIFIRSASELLDRAKRQKRSAFANMGLKDDAFPSDTGKLSVLSGSGVKNLRVHLKEVDQAKQVADFASHVEDVEEIIKLDESPNKKVQLSGSVSTMPSKVTEVSPVCMPQNSPRTGKRGLSRPSIARELLSLEIKESLPTPKLKDLRRRKDMTNSRVLFSRHLDEDVVKQQKKILARLGVPVASSISDATHFVADKFVRTGNMLEAMALGKPVVNTMWLESCGQASCFIDERNYILRDVKKEKEIRFSMPISLASACQCPLLQGKRVFITQNVKPSRELIGSLIKASAGQPMERVGRSVLKETKVPDDLLVISCEEDYAICVPLLERGAGVFSSEFLLNGIVIQKLEYERHRLFSDHVKRTRSTIWLRGKKSDQFLPVSKDI
ncbi:uncharacterized protein [Typha latifolia]|uniref:uncharacterized protein isoform X1 n=3 Tax=Typha latifolia TaxID=4733 RepID=UPI003C2E9A9B